MASKKPPKIGKYDVIDVVGRGGMGIVYKATDPDLGRVVAIKVMTAGFADDPDLLKRFFREAQSTSSLQHPNIVTVYELGDHGGTPYLVMEFLEGESLDSIISSRKQLTLLEKINLILGVAHGLSHAHHRGIVHRDIKPANIMVSKDGVVKIVDFGIAHIGAKSVTRTGQIVGSIIYMAPEQINGKPVDVRTDIFSTGVVLYQLVTYSHPFDAESMAATLLKIIHEAPPSLKTFLSTYPPELEAIIFKALAKDREERYLSAEDLALDLSQLQGQLRQEFISKHLQEVTLLLERADFLEAKDQLLQVLKIDRQNTDANLLLREVQQRIQREEISKQVGQLRMQAEDAYAQENFEVALGHLDRALGLDRNNGELQQLRESIQTAWSRARALQEMLRQAEIAYQTGDLDTAKQAVEEGLEWAPNDVHAKALHGAIQRDWAERLRQRELENYLAQARREIAARNFTTALDLLKQADSLDPGAPQVNALIESATAGREQERRRRELETINREIEEALTADDYLTACRKADEGLERFPEERTLLKLKALAEKQRQIEERKQFVDERLAYARTLLEQGRSEELLSVLEAALAKIGPEPRLQSLLLIVRDNVQHERVERRKAEYLRKANDALRHKSFDEAIQTLETALGELKESAEIGDLLQFAKEEAIAEKRRQIVEAAAQKANDFIARQEYEQAIHLLEATLEEIPDEELRIVLAEALRASQEYKKKLETTLSNAEKLLKSLKASEALRLLEAHVAVFSHNLAFQNLLETARNESARLRKIDEIIGSAREALEKENYEAARDLLQQGRQLHGSTPDLEQNLEEVTEKQTRAAGAVIQKALTDAQILVMANQFRAALDKLAVAADRVAVAPSALKAEYEDLRQQASNGFALQQAAQIQTHVAAGEVTQAGDLLRQALSQFSDNSDLLGLEKVVREEGSRRSEAHQTLAEAERLFGKAEWQRGGEVLRQAFGAAPQLAPAVREQVLASFVRAAKSALETDWHASEALLSQLSELEPEYIPPADLQSQITQHKRQEFVNRDLPALLVLDRLDEAKHLQSIGDLQGALREVGRGLTSFGNESRLVELHEKLHDQIRQEKRARDERARVDLDAYVRSVVQRAQAEPNLEQRVHLLEEALTKYPLEPRLQQQLTETRDLSEHVRAIVDEAGVLEKSRRYGEAIQKWNLLQNVYGEYPGLHGHLERVRNLDEQRRTAARSAWIQTVQEGLASLDFDRVALLLAQGKQEFPGIRELSEFEKKLQEGLKLRSKAQKVIADGRDALRKRKWGKASDYLARASDTAGRDPVIREQVLIELLEGCEAALDIDRQSAEKFLARATELQPASPLLSPMRARVENHKREQIIERHMSAAVLAQSGGDLQGALRELAQGLQAYPNEPRLSQFKSDMVARLAQREHARQLDLERQNERTRQQEVNRNRTAATRAPETADARAHDLERKQERLDGQGEAVLEGGNEKENPSEQAEKPRRVRANPADKLPIPVEVVRQSKAWESAETVITPPPSKGVPLPPNFLGSTRVLVIGAGAALLACILLMAWKLIPHPVPVQIATVPAGATIRIKSTGQECVTPRCSIKLRPGQYEIEARLQGYETRTQTIAVNDWGSSSGPIQMKAITTTTHTASGEPGAKKEDLAHLEIRGARARAEVLIDNKPLGKTDRQGNFKGVVPAGEHQIIMKSTGQDSSILSRTFPVGGNVVLNKPDFQPPSLAKPESLETPPPSAGAAAEQFDWQMVRDSSSIQDWERFGERYPRSEHLSAVNEKLDNLYWNKAKATNTAVSFDEYLAKYPGGRHGDEARESLAWGKAESSNTIPALLDYLKQYPQESPHSEAANKKIGELRFEMARTSEDEGTLGAFLKDYPSGELHGQIYRRLDEVVWQRTNKSDPVRLQSYMARFPDGTHLVEARNAIEKLAPLKTAKIPPPMVDDKAAVLDVIAQYHRAYNDRDLEGLQNVWPGMTRQQIKSVGDFFKTATSVKMTYGISAEPKIAGSEAVVTVQQSLEYLMDGSWQKAKPITQIVRLKKLALAPGNSAWKIDSVR